MKKYRAWFSFFLFIGATALILVVMILSLPPTIPPAPVSSTFVYSFNAPGVLQESGSMDTTSSPYFWLSSGGELATGNYVGETMQGDDTVGDYWQTLYEKNNPLDTDNGIHPQNLFRLVTRSFWSDFSEQAGFYIVKDNFSASPNRNASNGLFFMSRYQDQYTLYYAGVRVDGTAVIKKKYHGTYYTMAHAHIFPGTYSGWQDAVNLLPHGEWIQLKNTAVTNADGSVTLTLFMMLPGSTSWGKLLSAADTGQYAGTPAILGPGYAGIRTDFMDVEFNNFRLASI
jgi:hypothetical protein